MPQAPSIPPSFAAKKSKILASLALPSSTYTDLSPKGTVDGAIIPLIEQINQLDGVVTTSSCAGRVSVFLEGKKLKGVVETEDAAGNGAAENDVRSEQVAVPGGKGIGGRWLFVSHDPVDVQHIERSKGSLMELFGMSKRNDEGYESSTVGKEMRLVRFQFEPMILHIMTASLAHASPILAAAINAGFRESGVQSLKNLEDPASSFPMVAVRTSGLALESLIGCVMGDGPSLERRDIIESLVNEEYLEMLLEIANERFKGNEERMHRFESELFQRERKQGADWEHAEVRQARKRAEGLAKREALKRGQADKGRALVVEDGSVNQQSSKT